MDERQLMITLVIAFGFMAVLLSTGFAALWLLCSRIEAAKADGPDGEGAR